MPLPVAAAVLQRGLPRTACPSLPAMRALSRYFIPLKRSPDQSRRQMGAAIAFVVVAFVTISVAAGWRVWEERKSELEQAQIATANLSRSLAQHMQDAIKVSDTLLTGVVERTETEGLRPASIERIEKLFQRIVEETPQLHGIFVIDADGNHLASSFGILPRRGDIALPYFQHHMNYPGKEAFIGPPVRNRTTSDWTVTVSKRIDDDQGRFAGVALATIHMHYFQGFHQDFDIGQRGVMFVAFENGVLLTRYPFRPEVIGTRTRNSIITPANFSTRPTGSFTARSGVDGIERIYSYRYLDNYPLVAAVGLSREEVLAKWWTSMLTYVVGLMVMALILGALGLRLLGAIRAGLQAERNLMETHASLKRLNRTLESMALQDSLTSLANRRQFDNLLNTEYKRALRTGMPLSVMMIDVDYFKQFNDIYGHPEGDRCLKQVSETLTRSLARAGDLIARYGGEEFSVLLPNTDLNTAEMLAQRVCSAIEELSIPHTGSPLGRVTASIGVSSLIPGAALAQQMANQDDLVHAADRALYLAKRNGRNQVCVTDRNVSSLFDTEEERA